MVGNDTRFTGHPSQVWEDSMHGLMKGTLFRVSQEELDLHGSDSIALKDGGFAAGLGVAHNLHCVVGCLFGVLTYFGSSMLMFREHG